MRAGRGGGAAGARPGRDAHPPGQDLHPGPLRRRRGYGGGGGAGNGGAKRASPPRTCRPAARRTLERASAGAPRACGPMWRWIPGSACAGSRACSAGAGLCLGDGHRAVRVPAGRAAEQPGNRGAADRGPAPGRARARRGAVLRTATRAGRSTGSSTMAREFDVDIDMHLDLADTTDGMQAEYVCRKTEEFGWGGRVAVGHVTQMALLPPARFAALAATAGPGRGGGDGAAGDRPVSDGAGPRPCRAARGGAGGAAAGGGGDLLDRDQQRAEPVHARMATGRWSGWRTCMPMSATWRGRTDLAGCLAW